MRQSLRIIEQVSICACNDLYLFICRLPYLYILQCLNDMPAGDVRTDDAKCVPPSRWKLSCVLPLVLNLNQINA